MYFVFIMDNRTEIGSCFLVVKIFDWKEMMFLLLCSREGIVAREEKDKPVLSPIECSIKLQSTGF